MHSANPTLSRDFSLSVVLVLVRDLRDLRAFGGVGLRV